METCFLLKRLLPLYYPKRPILASKHYKKDEINEGKKRKNTRAEEGSASASVLLETWNRGVVSAGLPAERVGVLCRVATKSI